MNPFRLLWEILHLRSELNNKCSGLIGGTTYIILSAAITIKASLWYFGG